MYYTDFAQRFSVSAIANSHGKSRNVAAHRGASYMSSKFLCVCVRVYTCAISLSDLFEYYDIIKWFAEKIVYIYTYKVEMTSVAVASFNLPGDRINSNLGHYL